MTVSNSILTIGNGPGSIQGLFRQRDRDFTTLESAVKSGDLATAQKAFAEFERKMGTKSFSRDNQANADFETFKKALLSGDLSKAQDAFETLKQDVQSIRQKAVQFFHQHHHKKDAGANSTNSPIPTPESVWSGNTLDTQA